MAVLVTIRNLWVCEYMAEKSESQKDVPDDVLELAYLYHRARDLRISAYQPRNQDVGTLFRDVAAVAFQHWEAAEPVSHIEKAGTYIPEPYRGIFDAAHNAALATSKIDGVNNFSVYTARAAGVELQAKLSEAIDLLLKYDSEL